MTASIHWFRHGLRLHDNEALLKALDGSTQCYPVFIDDGFSSGLEYKSYIRNRFLHECLVDLDKQLKKYGSRLYFLEGEPEDVLAKACKEWNVTRLTFIQDPEPCYAKRDNKVKQMCKKNDIECIETMGHTLWDPKEILEENGGQVPITFKIFCQAASNTKPPSRPVAFPDFSKLTKEDDSLASKFQLPDDLTFGVEPEEDQLKLAYNVWVGGETQSLVLLKIRLEREAEGFKKKQVNVNQIDVNLCAAPRSLSPYLRFGALSVRRFYWEILDAFHHLTGSSAPLDAVCQLIWREYFIVSAFNNPNFDRIKDNPVCLPIQWYEEKDKIEKWTYGKTGFPWIDACMNQLRAEGWMHHVGRHATASFLTRGELWQSWEVGAQAFYKYQIDGDWSLCAGNWMWISSSAFENSLSCPRCFSPTFYGAKMDPNGEYVRRYVPALKDMPIKWLFWPWKAPLDVQKEAGCIIGKDYPEPMVDHKLAWKECKQKMQEFINSVADKDFWHLKPSSTVEVQRFVCLPENKCSGDFDCNCQDCDY